MEWNVIISVKAKGFKQAVTILTDFGHIRRTDFYNVLVMQVNDIYQMLDTLRERTLEDPQFLSFLSRLIPVTNTFTFQSPEEFENKAKEIVLAWIPQLEGKGFHVRMHRRGFKGKLSSLDEERLLDNTILESMKMSGIPGYITFDNPDVIIAVETLAQRAGFALWTREDLKKYPFIRLD